MMMLHNFSFDLSEELSFTGAALLLGRSAMEPDTRGQKLLEIITHV